MAHFAILIFIILAHWSPVKGLSCWKCIPQLEGNNTETGFGYKCEADLAGFKDDCGQEAVCVAREDWNEASGTLIQREMYCVSNEGGVMELPTGCLTYKNGEGMKATLIKSCLCNHENECNRVGFEELHKILPKVDGNGRILNDSIITNAEDSQVVPSGRSVRGLGKRRHAHGSSTSSKKEVRRKRRKNKRKHKFRYP